MKDAKKEQITTKLPDSSYPSQFDQTGIYDQINQYFSEQDKQQKIVLEAREVLGQSAESMNDVQVYDLFNEMYYLVETWMEEFEKNAFGGKTLKELLEIVKS